MTFMNGLKKKPVRLILSVTVVLIACMSVSGCLAEKYSVSTLSGLYEEYSAAYGRMLTYRISLNPDSTYIFHYMYDIADLSSDGNWWIEGDYVILNSFVQDYNCFPVDVHQIDSLPQTNDFVIRCDKMAYRKCFMYFLSAGDSVAINTDTISFERRSFPDTIIICIKAKAGFIVAKSDNIIIKEPGIYQVETNSVFLQERPLNYLELKKRKFKILSKDSIQDVYSTNATLIRSTSD